MVTEERDSLASNHDEAQERILMLERTKREAEQKVGYCKNCFREVKIKVA